jgi:hypothetical protein
MHIFLPIVLQVKEDRLLRSFPGKTYGDLYLWVVRHWDNLKHDEDKDVSIAKASKDFKSRFARGRLKRWFSWLRETLNRS